MHMDGIFVKRVRARAWNGYFRWEVDLPRDVMEKMGVSNGDYLVFAVRKADWYDLLDLEEGGYVWSKLPEDVRKHVRELRLAEEKGGELTAGRGR